MKIKTFRDLIAWQKGMELACLVYRETERMPKQEMFGLTSQMRRAATSIPLNIAEGFGNWTRPSFVRGLRLSAGSLMELMTAYELATQLKMLRQSDAMIALLAEEDRLLQALIRSLPLDRQAKPSKKD